MIEERYWQAVLDRDKGMDGQFVMGVRSTGIYCRPSCPARKPRRENVLFFDGPDGAEAAGFRACLRCRPRDLEDVVPGAEIAERASRYIEANLDGDGTLTLAAIGEHIGISQYHLQRVFRRVMGVTPKQYAAALRLERLKTSLRSGENVTNAMYDAGYGSSSRLYETAHAGMGMTPGSYRRGGEGMTITYTIADSSLGRLLVGATEHGICAVGLSDSDDALLASLRSEYPAAHLKEDAAALQEWANDIVCSLEERRPQLDLPLDVQGTPFQERVWQSLRTIPYGTTRSYSEVAEAIGQPSAVRAVARACATNHVALVIPCHRVVRGDGSLGGYKWGIDRKEALLAREQRGALVGAGAPDNY
ncbi:MAG: bifunctional DNA-binding transcriptional regulator/O6-methylguanine-DNA methyltransferase Ada [Chloroflexota bacterium]